MSHRSCKNQPEKSNETVDEKAKRKLKEIEEFDKNTDEKKPDSSKEETATVESEKELESNSLLPPPVKHYDDRIVYPFVGVYLSLKSNVSLT